MNTREIASEYRLTHWAQILQERTARKLSVREFCKTAGIQENVYFYWQRKLREAACEELSSRAKNESGGYEASHVPNGWALCKSEEDVKPGKPLVVEVNGFRMYVEPDTSPEEVAKVCGALKALC